MRRLSDPSSAQCIVCLACQGIFLNATDAEMEEHNKKCAYDKPFRNDTLLKYFMCDKKDFLSLMNLKRHLGGYFLDGNNCTQFKCILNQDVINCLLDLVSFKSVQFKPITKYANSGDIVDAANECYHSECQVDLESETITTDKLPTNEKTTHKVSKSSVKEAKRKEKGVGELKQCGQSKKVSGSKAPSAISNVEESDQSTDLLRHCHKQSEGNCVKYVCKLCSYAVTSRKLMLRHQGLHNDGSPFECEPCKFSTLWSKEWKIHIKQKHGGEKLLCHMCPQEFQTAVALDRHIVSAHADSNGQGERHRLQCDYCDYVAREMASLKEHMRKHTGDALKCPHEGCKFQSFYTRSLNKHLRQKHSAEKTQCCDICGFQTRHSSSLTKHINLKHRDHKPFKCGECSFSALSSAEVIAHAERKHLKQKRFQCPQCPFKTGYPLAIQKHVARHLETDKLNCHDCRVVFAIRYRARKHMQQEHGFTKSQATDKPYWIKINPNDYKIKDQVRPKGVATVVSVENPNHNQDKNEQEDEDVIFNSKENLLVVQTNEECERDTGVQVQIMNSLEAIDTFIKLEQSSMNNQVYDNIMKLDQNSMNNQGSLEAIDNIIKLDQNSIHSHVQINVNSPRTIPHPHVIKTEPNGDENSVELVGSIQVAGMDTIVKTEPTNNIYDLSVNFLQASEDLPGGSHENVATSPMDIEPTLFTVSRTTATEPTLFTVSRPTATEPTLFTESRSTATEPTLFTVSRPTMPTQENNPMLSATSANLGEDDGDSLSSLFDLMSDFPRPTPLNRCQSASTLMFASLSPHHLIDRPLTPDFFFTETPSVSSLFSNLL